MKKTLIFSDVHLKAVPEDKARHRAFIDFLHRFSPDEYDTFICLGDLFDFWFEYRSIIFSDFFDVLRAFADIRDRGVELHLICGNHDFWAGRFLRDDLGFHIHPDVMEHPFGDLRGHLVHGDGINPEDKGYRAYKKFARNPLVVGAFRCIHPDLAMAIARGVSHGSRTLTSSDDPAAGPEANALRRYAAGVLQRGAADVVLCGHAHAPTLEELPALDGTGLYINTGDWIDHRSHTIWDGETFSQYVEGPGIA
ncbi:MAG: UDP-2,3-diacylglucosamine diphosphatase [Candidatus Hydrogenedentes bacterium]|nr:UDP-2,3-diacylglucosamine diphosphatase [Candidatus Hydrogenedentota bacterium]